MSGARLAWEPAVFLLLFSCSSLLVSAHICLWHCTCDSSIVTYIYYDRHVEHATKSVAPYSACVTLLPLVSINMCLKFLRVVSIITAVTTLKLSSSLCTAVPPPRLGPCNDIGSNGPGRALMKRGRSRIVRPAIIFGNQPQQACQQDFLVLL